jgi:hypothetical protein
MPITLSNTNTGSIVPIGGSLSFSGTNYISVTNSASLNPGTGDFTIEFWTNLNSITNNASFWRGNNNGVDVFMNGTGKLSMGQAQVSTKIIDSVNMTTGSWVHVAVARASSTTRLFKNGTLVGSSGGDTTNYVVDSINYIGNQGTFKINGYISNLRVVISSALYTGSFTPPTSPLTAIANTQLLLNTTNDTNYLKDNSTNNFTVTNNGSVTSSSLSPFTGSIISSFGNFQLINTSNSGRLSMSLSIQYSAGLFKTTYSGYFADNVSFFATATSASVGGNPATSVQTTVISEPATDDGSNFSVQWLGYFKPTTTETYTFFTNSDDASYMWIGANALSGFTTANATVNNGGTHADQERSGTSALTAGIYYPIRIQFGESGGGDNFGFNYSTPTITKTTNVTGLVFYNPTTNGF